MNKALAEQKLKQFRWIKTYLETAEGHFKWDRLSSEDRQIFNEMNELQERLKASGSTLESLDDDMLEALIARPDKSDFRVVEMSVICLAEKEDSQEEEYDATPSYGYHKSIHSRDLTDDEWYFLQHKYPKAVKVK